MSVLTVPRSIARSRLKNFSMNFTATVPPPNWQGPRKRVSTSKRQLVCLNKGDYRLGDCLRSYKQLIVRNFLRAYRYCSVLPEVVPVSRVQIDLRQTRLGKFLWP